MSTLSTVFGESKEQLLTGNNMFVRGKERGDEVWVITSVAKSQITEFVHSFLEQHKLSHVIHSIFCDVCPTSTSHPMAPYVDVHITTRVNEEIPEDVYAELNEQVRLTFPSTKMS